MDARQTLARIEKEFGRIGLLLQHDRDLPSFTTLVAGKPIVGSWWGHRRGKVIYGLLEEFHRGAGTLSAKLVNGKIHTMDARDRVVSQVLVRNGRFAAVGDGGGAQGRNVRTINLKGRTVVPGLIEGHVHMMSLAGRMG